VKSIAEFCSAPPVGYAGQYVDLDGAYGPQCVDLADLWCRNLGIETFPGNAGDFEFDSHPDCDWVANTPTGVPPAGSIVVWAKSSYWGLPYGHVGVGAQGPKLASGLYIAGDPNSFTSFDQNWPLGSAPHRQAHSYNDVAGWLVPRRFRWGFFTGRIDVPSVHVRQGPDASTPLLYTLAGGTLEGFDGYCHTGKPIADAITGKPDDRWFHIISDGRHGWVASAYVNGNPAF
jgi:hypothetical protein